MFSYRWSYLVKEKLGFLEEDLDIYFCHLIHETVTSKKKIRIHLPLGLHSNGDGIIYNK
jgi:hypothetical protein